MRLEWVMERAYTSCSVADHAPLKIPSPSPPSLRPPSSYLLLPPFLLSSTPNNLSAIATAQWRALVTNASTFLFEVGHGRDYVMAHETSTLKSYLVRFLVSGRPRGNSASRLEHITGPTTPAAAETGAYYYIGATQPAFMGNAQSRLHLRIHRNGRTTPAILYTCRNTAIRSGIDCQARCACCNSIKTILQIRTGTSLLHTTPHNEQTLRPVWDRPAAGKARV